MPLEPLRESTGLCHGSRPMTGVWTTAANDEFTLQLAPADAAALCLKAAENTKWMNVKETESNRVLVKYMPMPIGKAQNIEVLLADAEGGGTTVTLNGSSFGRGPGGKPQVKKAMGALRTAIEEQAQSG